MQWSVVGVALLLSAWLAGCSDSPAAETQATNLDFEDLDVKATATTGAIRGVVVDEAIRPLDGATILLTPGDKTATTTEAGLFAFSSLEPGTYFLTASKPGFNGTQTSADVVAGDEEPPIVKILLKANPSEVPYVEAYQLKAFMTCGVAVVASSVGCGTFPAVGEGILGDRLYFPFDFDVLPMWAQGELVWEQTQAAGGEAIWQLAGCGGYCDGPPAMASPALTFISDETINDNADSILEDGLQYNLFGGPHPLCTVDNPYTPYGCGVTLNQAFDVFVHHFFNFKPEEGWRFTSHGEPKPPN